LLLRVVSSVLSSACAPRAFLSCRSQRCRAPSVPAGMLRPKNLKATGGYRALPHAAVAGVRRPHWPAIGEAGAGGAWLQADASPDTVERSVTGRVRHGAADLSAGEVVEHNRRIRRHVA